MPRVTFNGIAERLVVNQVGNHPDFAEMWYHPDVPNLLSYGELCKQTREK